MSDTTTEGQEIPKIEYTEEERKVLNMDISTMYSMYEDFNRPYVELDGMNRVQYYDSNRKKDLSYIPPKKNKQDVRIVTGTTREKDTTLLSTMLNLNAEEQVNGFDDEDMIVAELGDNMTDLIFKSRQIEDYDKLEPIILRELISQGDVFVEETFIDEFRRMPLQQVRWNPFKDTAAKLSYVERLKKIGSHCQVRMLKGTSVYLGDMSIEYIEDQDKVAICNIYSRGKAESMYGTWDRWKNVPKQVSNIAGFEYSGSEYDRVWAMFDTGEDKVSEVKLFCKKENRLQIYLNGIPMLPCNFPLTSMYPSGELPFAQGKLEPISGFAMSKSQPSKTKVDQETIDEVTTLMIEGIRQSRKPPMGHANKRVYGQNIFLAGSMTSGVKENAFHSLLPTEALGLKSAEFSFYNLIKESINEKTTNEVYSGAGQGNVDTLGQAEIMQQQQQLKLGSALDGQANLRRRLGNLRIDNILNNWTLPVDSSIEEVKEGVLGVVNKYKNITVETTVENGEKGMKVFKMTDKPFPGTHDAYKEEDELSEEQGKPVRIIYMNPEMLRKRKYKWYITINPTPKSGDRLSQILFVQNVQRAMQMFGPESMNMEYVKQRFAIIINEDYNKFFKEVDIMQMIQQGQSPNGSGGTAQATGGAPPVASKDTNALNLATK